MSLLTLSLTRVVRHWKLIEDWCGVAHNRKSTPFALYREDEGNLKVRINSDFFAKNHMLYGFGGLAQMVERLLRMREVMSSILISSIHFFCSWSVWCDGGCVFFWFTESWSF